MLDWWMEWNQISQGTLKLVRMYIKKIFNVKYIKHHALGGMIYIG